MRLNLEELLTTEVREPVWIVEGIIPASTIVLVAGDAGVGKSTMNLSEGLHIALGLPHLGHQTVQGRVLYFDEENSRPDIASYLQQLWLGMGQPNPAILKQNFAIEHFSLGNPRWAEAMDKLATEFQPQIIYIDTATSTLAIEDENQNAEAQRAVQKLRHIVRDTASHPAIKILKHAKYQSGGGHKGQVRRTIRGAKAWVGAVDQTMYHIRAQGAPLKGGFHRTILVPDKRRAFGLRGNIRITPHESETLPKSLVLKGEVFESKIDLMLVGEEE